MPFEIWFFAGYKPATFVAFAALRDLMEKRKLGDLEVTALGFGAWGIGGAPFWTTEGDAESIRAIKRAYAGGINFFDTAPVYGFGRSERLLAKALKGKRDRVVLATKAGLRWEKESLGSIRRDSSADSIQWEIEQSLKRLETDYIDLYQVHWPDPETPLEETMTALMRLKEEGKVRHIGLSNFSRQQIEEALKYGEAVSLQSKYNLLERDLEREEIPFCLEHNVAIIPYSPLASGILTGKYGKDAKFTDWRGKGHGKNFSGEIYAGHIRKVEKLKEIASECGKKAHHLALAWLLNRPGVVSVPVGVKNAAQVEDNLEALGWEIPKETRDIFSPYFP